MSNKSCDSLRVGVEASSVKERAVDLIARELSKNIETMFYPLLTEEQVRILDDYKRESRLHAEINHELIGKTFVQLAIAEVSDDGTSYRQLKNILISEARKRENENG